MKFFSVFLVFSVLVFSSCEKQEDIIEKTFFTYTIDGTNYRQEVDTPIIQEFDGGLLEIICSHEESGSGFHLIGESFNKSTGSLEATFARFTGPNNGIFAINYEGIGTIEVTKIKKRSKYVEGTFTFKDENEEITVSDGAFLLRYEL